MTLNGRGMFSLFIAILMGFMVFISFNYGIKARLFPVGLGSIIFFMSGLQLLGETFPSIKKRLKFLEQKGVTFGGSSSSGKDESQNREKETALKEEQIPWRKLAVVFSLLLIFVILFYYTSFLIAVPVFILLFIWLIAREKFMQALGISLGTVGFMFVLFRVILQANF